MSRELETRLSWETWVLGRRCWGGEEEALSSLSSGTGSGPLPSAESRESLGSAPNDIGESDLSDIFYSPSQPIRMLRLLRSFSISHIPPLKAFLQATQGAERTQTEAVSSLKYFIETYGCQMNSNDSAIVESVLRTAGMSPSESADSADIVLLNTCAIRDHAEQKIWQRLYEFRALRRKGQHHTIAVLGCMAERLKDKLLSEEQLAHVVVGPDAYRSLPGLLEAVRSSGETAMDVKLSQEETYADISPVRTEADGVSASISIMRGCNNMCSFCVVPFTRGRERSREMASILQEVWKLAESGTKEITFLGQNVNSYVDATSRGQAHSNTPGFAEMYRLRDFPGARFADLLSEAAQTAPKVRFRFTSPHPKDFPQALVDTIKHHSNVCKQVHLPVQSGSTSVLQRMRRGYTREAYLDLLHHLRAEIPHVSVSTDLIAGFCGESEEDHKWTLDLVEKAKFEQAFMFAYSMRPRTHAANNYPDDVPQSTKLRRLQEIIDLQRSIQKLGNEAEVGKSQEVLIEGGTKRSEWQFTGRADSGKRVIVEVAEGRERLEVGSTVQVRITASSPQTLFGQLGNS